MEGKWHEGYAKTFRLRDKTTLLHLVITREIIRVKMGMSGYVVSKFYYFGNTYPVAASPCSPSLRDPTSN
jgi:hypothetical protein